MRKKPWFWFLLVLALLILAGIGAAYYYGVSWQELSDLSFEDLSTTVKALIVAVVIVFVVRWII